MHMHMMARAELFNPRLQTNIKSTIRVVELGTVAVDALLKEFHDEIKASYVFLCFKVTIRMAVLPRTSQAGNTWDHGSEQCC